MFRQLWQRIAFTNHRGKLEAEIMRQRAEIDRLRAENRALLDSILGIAGIPPLSIPQARLTVDLGAPFDAEPLSSQSHSESSTRPLADDDSTFRPPPPANHAGTNGLSALRQESERSDSTGAPLPSEQEGAPRSTVSRAWGIDSGGMPAVARMEFSSARFSARSRWISARCRATSASSVRVRRVRVMRCQSVRNIFIESSLATESLRHREP